MKKTFAIILSIIMAISMIPFNAFAFDGTISDINLERAKPLEVFFEVDGFWDTDEQEMPYFRYNGFIGRGDGDVFTITDSDEHVYEYTAKFNDEDREFYLYCEENGDVIPYNDIEMIDEQDHIGRHFTLGDDNYFTIEYKGVRKNIPVSVIKNPVDSINYIPVSEIEIVEHTHGHWGINEKTGEDFFFYDMPSFRVGDILEVTYAGDENPTIYYYSDEYGQRAFYTELGEELPEEGNLVSSMDTYADWNVEDGGEYSVEYSGRESTVSLSIVKNTITEIDYQRNGKDEYLEGDTRYDEYDDAYYYDNPSFREGDVLTVYEGETPSVYTCVFNWDIMEYEFLSEDETSSISTDWDSGVRISTNQRENPWTLGDKNEFYVEYMGRSKTLYATVKENPVLSIGYERADDDVYIYELDGEEYNGFFEYWLRMPCEGDILTVNYKNGQTVKYTCRWNEEKDEREFVSPNGEVIEERSVDIRSDQYNHHWEIGSENEYTVSYSGKSVTLYATVEPDPVSGIEYSRVEPYQCYENTEGWEDDEGHWRYNEPDFLQGDTITVTYSDESEKVFTFDYSEEYGYSLFIAKDGEVLEDVRKESNQWEQPWSVGDDNEYFISYHGKYSKPIKVTILKNTVTGIDYVKAWDSIVFESEKKEMIFPPTGEVYEGYDISYFGEGDKLIVHDSEAGDKEFKLIFDDDDDEFYFVCGDERIDMNSVYIYDYQYSVPWTVDGDNYFEVEYLGKKARVPVKVVQSDVARIEFKIVNPERLVLTEEENGRWQGSGDDEFYFYDYEKGWIGDQLVVYYTGGSKSVYTVKFDGTPDGVGVYLENDEGDIIEQKEVDIFDRQWDEHWYVGEENCYFVKYSGATCAVPVTINHNYQKKVVKPTCTSDGYTLYTCKACKDEYKTQITKATGHKWNSGKITSTTSSKYTKTFTCTVCKKTEKKTYSKKANSLSKAKGKKVTVKYSSLKKKNQTVKKDSAFSLGGAQGKITFKKSSGNSKISVSSSGKITVKKGLKKGTYTVKVKISASGSDTYKAGSKTVSVTIVVK